MKSNVLRSQATTTARVLAPALLSAFSLFAAQVAQAQDAACMPVLKATEALLAQSAWHSVSQLDAETKVEAMKVGGKFYSNINNAWMAMPLDLDAASRKTVEQMRSGAIKLSNCKAAGDDMVDGVAVSKLEYHVEMQGAPAADAVLYVGKSDNLPYRQTGSEVTVTYKYKGVNAPAL
jgi:hypothetical protein